MLKKILIIQTRKPCDGIIAHETLSLALTTATFDHRVQLLFLEDGVFQLVNHQNPDNPKQKSLAKIFEVLTLYDIYEVFADKCSLQQRKLISSLLIPTTKVINSEEIHALCHQQDIVITL